MAEDLYVEGVSLLMAAADDLTAELEKRFGKGFTKEHPEVLTQWLQCWTNLQLANSNYANRR